jgi:hypothetical protein
LRSSLLLPSLIATIAAIAAITVSRVHLSCKQRARARGGGGVSRSNGSGSSSRSSCCCAAKGGIPESRRTKGMYIEWHACWAARPLRSVGNPNKTTHRRSNLE